MFDVISFGSAILDVFLQVPELKVEKTKVLPSGQALMVPYGTKAEVKELKMCSGGGGTNTAVGFARLGLKATVVARCGDDLAGHLIRQEIKKEGVGDRFLVQIKGERTDFSTILLGPDGGSTILVYRGGTRLEKENIDFSQLKASWFYFSSLEGNLELLAELVAYARQKKIKVAVNPGRRELKQKRKLLELARDFDIFILNREEASELLELPIKDQKIFTRACLVLPRVMTVVTDGARGVSVCVPQKGRLVMEGLRVKRVDATGAGDAFGSGLIAGLVKGWSLEKALKLGVVNGAVVVTKIGAKTGLLREPEIDFWLQKPLAYHWQKQ